MRKNLRQNDFAAGYAQLLESLASLPKTSEVLDLLLRAAGAQDDPEAVRQSLTLARKSGFPFRLIRNATLAAVVGRKIAAQGEILQLLFGAVPTSLDDAVARFPGPLLPAEQGRRVLRFVRAATGQKPEDPRAWLQRLDEGYKRNCIRLALRYHSKLQRVTAEGRPPATSAIHAAAVQAPLEAGRSVILLGIHAIPLDIQISLSRWLQEHKIPISLIGNGVSSDTTSGNFHLKTAGADLVIEFAKLCKLMRKGPRLVRILPDGGMGGAFSTMRMGDHELTVGLGAAKLAYFGKSTLAFGHNRWTEGGLATEYWSGPEVTPEMSPEDVEALMTEFYRASLIRLLSGDPVNFGLHGGYWTKIRLETDE